MYIHFVNAMGHLTIRFLCVKELSSGSTADEIYKCVLQALDESDLDINKLCALATDGASVMTGVHKGVASRLKKDVSHLISTHCMAHHLQLVGEKAAAKVPLIQKFIDILNQFARCLKFSPKLTRILENAKQLNGEKAAKIKQVFFTRWLSLGDSVKALTGCIASVLSAILVAAAERGRQRVELCCMVWLISLQMSGFYL